jgi:hypothetical protein
MRASTCLSPGTTMTWVLHATCIYTGESQICCYGYFVAYSGALLHARQTFKSIRHANADTLIVAVDNSFKDKAILLTLEEARTARKHLSPSARVVQVSRSENALEYIRSASIW